MINQKQKQALTKTLKKAFKNTTEPGGGKEFRFYHSQQVATFAMKIVDREGLDVDRDALYLAALFHDIGKIEAVAKNGAIDYQSEANQNHELIASLKLLSLIGHIVTEKNLLDQAAQIIIETKSGPKSLKGKVLKDADELGNFGYSQIWRTFTYAVPGNLTLSETIEYWEKEGRASRQQMLKNLYFEASKRVAKERLNKTEAFFKEIKKEVSGKDL